MLAKDLSVKKLKTIMQNVNDHTKDFKEQLIKSSTYNRTQLKVWEVYAGLGRLTDDSRTS